MENILLSPVGFFNRHMKNRAEIDPGKFKQMISSINRRLNPLFFKIFSLKRFLTIVYFAEIDSFFDLCPFQLFQHLKIIHPGVGDFTENRNPVIVIPQHLKRYFGFEILNQHKIRVTCNLFERQISFVCRKMGIPDKNCAIGQTFFGFIVVTETVLYHVIIPCINFS